MGPFNTFEKKTEKNVSKCSDDKHHFADLKHFTHHSECKCQKCGLVVEFNRGWPERIQANEWEAFVEKYKGSKLDFNYPHNDEMMKGLDLLIRDDNYYTWVACCLLKTTQEAYIVRGNNTFFGDPQRGGRMESHISSISIASFEEVSSIVNKELDYNTFYTYQTKYRSITQKKLIIAQKAYRIEYFIVIDSIEVPQNQILFGKSVFQVPAQSLTEGQHKKYAEFYTCPGPYEHCYDLPVDRCQKVVQKLVSTNS